MWKKYLYLFGMLLLVSLLWNTWVIYPLKILVVFFHELSHGLMAIVTGGDIVRIEIVAQQGGVCWTRGGMRFFISSAGYLGSLVWGGLIFFLASKTTKDRLIMGVLGGLVFLITVLYLRNSFGFVFGILTGIFMWVAAKKFPEKANDFILRLIGLTSMVYVPLDIYDDTLRRSYLQSDAANLAKEFGGTTMFWGGSWLLISLVFLFVILKLSLKHDANFEPAPSDGLDSLSDIL